MHTNLPLPSRDGVAPSVVWLPDGPWSTVLEFLIERFAAIPESIWVGRMVRGEVVDAAGQRVSPDASYRSQTRLYYYREPPQEPRIPFEENVLYGDAHLLAVDKPHFLPVTPSGRYLQETLLVRLKRKLNLEAIVPIHRIDRETAGVVLFSVDPRTRGLYQSLFRKREVEKTYYARAPWRSDMKFPLVRRTRLVEAEPFFLMKEAEGEPNTETRIEVQEVLGVTALYRLTPTTGRKHQLRVHMSSLGLAIINDRFYPTLRPADPQTFDAPLQLLAKSVAFVDPITHEPRVFESRREL